MPTIANRGIKAIPSTGADASGVENKPLNNIGLIRVWIRILFF